MVQFHYSLHNSHRRQFRQRGRVFAKQAIGQTNGGSNTAAPNLNSKFFNMDIEKLNEAYGKAVALSIGVRSNPELERISHDVVIFLGGLIEEYDDKTDEQLSSGITG